MSKQNPSVGRDVHYVSYGSPRLSDGSQIHESTCRAAKITQVHDGEPPEPGQVFVGLCVFNPEGLHFPRTVLQDDDDKTPGTWHWPERV